MTFQRIWGRFSPIAWLFPLAIMVVGAFYAPLRIPVSLAVPQISMTPGLLVQLILSLAWMLAEFRFAASRETTIKQLQTDAFRSLLLSLLLTFGAGWLLSVGACPWFYVVPTVTAIVDAFLTANQGLNNAAQKPFVPHLKA
ncbi:MAG TPA: hypothetical protein VE986_06905 [Hyphomicrobiales bacterium]|nr:hypothetical protein [Hyphomicrobiales bacterium]